MKILFVSNLYPPLAIGGYEKLCRDVAEALKSRGHEIEVLTSDFRAAKPPSPYSVADYSVHRSLKLHIPNEENIYDFSPLPASEIQHLEAHNKSIFETAVQNFSPDVIFVWNLFFLGREFSAHIDRCSRPTVFYLTDNWMKEFSLPKKSRCGAIFSSRFMRRFYRGAGFRFKTETVIHIGVDLQHLAGYPRRYELVPVPRLLFAGRVVQVKGLHVLLAAVQRLVRDSKTGPFLLDVVGDDSDQVYMDEVRSLLRKYELEKIVHFYPPVPVEQLKAVFDEHDLLIFPSLYEPFSMLLIKALASGIPVIGSDAGGNVEILKNGVNALIYPKDNSNRLAKCIRRSIIDQKFRQKIGVNGQRTTVGFSFLPMIERIEADLKRFSHKKL